ncbi:uncharacterized protein V1516DRAFT_668816 [Lipomyces oligophaga]|uniref:uncharacterized protein n=1 Tax=Lipomyces oligophaga TaxID=45792 RepID=UPI0034CED908
MVMRVSCLFPVAIHQVGFRPRARLQVIGSELYLPFTNRFISSNFKDDIEKQLTQSFTVSEESQNQSRRSEDFLDSPEFLPHLEHEFEIFDEKEKDHLQSRNFASNQNKSAVKSDLTVKTVQPLRFRFYEPGPVLFSNSSSFQNDPSLIELPVLELNSATYGTSSNRSATYPDFTRTLLGNLLRMNDQSTTYADFVQEMQNQESESYFKDNAITDKSFLNTKRGKALFSFNSSREMSRLFKQNSFSHRSKSGQGKPGAAKMNSEIFHVGQYTLIVSDGDLPQIKLNGATRYRGPLLPTATINRHGDNFSRIFTVSGLTMLSITQKKENMSRSWEPNKAVFHDNAMLPTKSAYILQRDYHSEQINHALDHNVISDESSLSSLLKYFISVQLIAENRFEPSLSKSVGEQPPRIKKILNDYGMSFKLHVQVNDGVVQIWNTYLHSTEHNGRPRNSDAHEALLREFQVESADFALNSLKFGHDLRILTRYRISGIIDPSSYSQRELQGFFGESNLHFKDRCLFLDKHQTTIRRRRYLPSDDLFDTLLLPNSVGENPELYWHLVDVVVPEMLDEVTTEQRQAVLRAAIARARNQELSDHVRLATTYFSRIRNIFHVASFANCRIHPKHEDNVEPLHIFDNERVKDIQPIDFSRKGRDAVLIGAMQHDNAQYRFVQFERRYAPALTTFKNFLKRLIGLKNGSYLISRNGQHLRIYDYRCESQKCGHGQLPQRSHPDTEEHEEWTWNNEMGLTFDDLRRYWRF